MTTDLTVPEEVIDPSTYSYNPLVEDMVDIICQRLQRQDRHFFRLAVLYSFADMAADLRYCLHTLDSGKIIINIFVIALAPSGFGKNRSLSLIKKQYTHKFNHEYEKMVFPFIAAKNISDIGHINFPNFPVTKKIPDVDAYIQDLHQQFFNLGPITPKFSEATPAGIKNYMLKMLMAGTGKLSLLIDEIGANLLKSKETFDIMLELYEEGETEVKLIKGTAENPRTFKAEGQVHTNMMIFGTPSKILNGGDIEKYFFEVLEQGLARRSMFALSETNDELPTPSLTKATEIFNEILKTNKSTVISDKADYFVDMADIGNNNNIIEVPADVSIFFNLYRMQCEHNAEAISDHEAIKKSELQNRASKAMKVAGVLAFANKLTVLDKETSKQAIKYVEDSAQSLEKLLKREEDHVKLATYLATIPKEEPVSDSGIMAVLPLFKKSAALRKDLIDLAIQYGISKGILIKRNEGGFSNLVTYYSETLVESDLDNCILSVSTQMGDNYEPLYRPFLYLENLGKHDNTYWCNHHFINQHRKEDNAMPAFNLIVLDIDEGTRRSTVHSALEHYKFVTHTTKRHSEEENRFRIIMPLKYIMKCTPEDFKKFMHNIYDFFPFVCDQSTAQRSKMWTMYNTTDTYINDGRVTLDPLNFAPSTDTQAAFQKHLSEVRVQHPGKFESFFYIAAKHTTKRNNLLARYGFALQDMGKNLVEIEHAIQQLNATITPPIPLEEIKNTMMVTIAKRQKDARNNPS